MCGLVGILSKSGEPIDFRDVWRMTEAVAHRGPDDSGYCAYASWHGRFHPVPAVREDTPRIKADFWMGFRRLSILDLSPLGHQPMLGQDEQTCITFNGEIYNYRELRQELVRQGYEFKSSGDTEVLLRLYEVYGISGLLERINGMFAFAIFDRRTRTLHIARDRFGIKPLFIYEDERVLIYASEIKSILRYSGVSPQLNLERLDEYLMFRYVAEPATLFQGIRALRPGHRLVVSNGSTQIVRYWYEPPYQPNPLSLPEAMYELRSRLTQSVDYRLISDVKVASLLSGGIDSSLLSVLMAEQVNGPIETLSVTLEDERLSEEKYVDIVAEKIGACTHKHLMGDEYFLNHVEEATGFLDVPLNHPQGVGFNFIARKARAHGITVLLSGEGADESFGGYQRFQRVTPHLPRDWLYPFRRLYRRWRNHQPLLPLADRLICMSRFGHVKDIQQFYPDFDYERALAPRRVLFEAAREESLLETFLAYERQTYMRDLLAHNDRMTMAASIECRVPYLDHHVVNFSKSLSSNYKVRSLLNLYTPQSTDNLKIILKRLTSQLFDADFVYRQKVGFSIGLVNIFKSDSFRAKWAPYRTALARRGLFDVNEVDGLLERIRGGDQQTARLVSNTFWPIFALEIWLKQVLEGDLGIQNGQ